MAPPLRAPVTRTMLQHSISGQRMTSFYNQVLTPALLVAVLGPVLGGNHLPLEDAPAHHRLPHLISGGRVILVSHHLDTLVWDMIVL